ncbi:COG4315 family predicted lipoprotein [Kribbella sp. NPDC055071]
MAILGTASCGGEKTASSPTGQNTGPSTSEPSNSGEPEVPIAPSEPLPTPTVKPGKIHLAVRDAQVKGTAAQIVTINGWTAYRFEGDDPKHPKVTCDYDCLYSWPGALTDGSPVEVEGIDKSLVSTVPREDGLVQVTLAGWPLYRFREDKAPADTNGEGIVGRWSVIKPDGKPVIKK